MEGVKVKSDYEIERGKPTPSKNHALVQTRLIVAFATKFQQYQVASEISLQVGSTEKVPDIAIFDNLEFTYSQDETRVSKVPLGVIEILSPTQNMTELLVKAHTYFDNGVQSYWLVLPALRSIYVFSTALDSEGYTHKNVLKDEKLGIELDLKEIF